MEITEAQTLADGTHIQRKSKALIYRDPFGRIRYENYSFTPLDREIHEAPNSIQIFDPFFGFTYWLTPRDAVAVRNRLGGSAANQKGNMQAQQSPKTDSASPQIEALKPIRVSKNLGTQLMEGLLVSGRRDTLTIPTGAEGNDRPLVIVSETWDSSDLGIRLVIKRSDPRNGETERRMTNFSWTEPDPSLFYPPSSYTIKGD